MAEDGERLDRTIIFRGRSSSLNRSQFLNDLENAMSGGRQKKRLLSDSAEPSDQQALPFPNR